MGISHRLWDDSVFVPVGEQAPEPAFVGQLLARLRLEDASKDEQVAGIRRWLENHHASKSLEISLDRRGFSELLSR